MKHPFRNMILIGEPAASLVLLTYLLMYWTAAQSQIAAPNYGVMVSAITIVLVPHLWPSPSVVCLCCPCTAAETGGIETTQVCHHCGSIRHTWRPNLSSEPITETLIKVKVSRCPNTGCVRLCVFRNLKIYKVFWKKLNCKQIEKQDE